MVGVARHVALALSALMLGSLGALAQVAPPPAAPTPAPAAQAAAPAPASPPDSLVFSTDVALVLHAIKPDKVADFESVMARLRVALQQSPDPTRAQQGAGWKVLKASEPGPAGSVLYVFVLDPVVKGADYTVSRILAEAFPDEIGVLWPKLRECYAGGLNRVSLAPLPATPPPPRAASTPRP
jgi:hypothetical protein